MGDPVPPGAAISSASLRSTILVADDEPLNRELVRALLPTGPMILEAANGDEALEIFKRENVDLVLLDVMMPGLSGHEVCRQMKAIKAETFVPVIMLTALSDQGSRNVGLESGADDYLCKPIDRRELVLRVSSFLRLRRHEVLIRRQVAELQHLQGLKDDLMSLLIHDLRNPLVGITSVLEMVLEGGPTDERLAPALEEALDAGRRVKEILDEALQVRLLEEGALALHRTVVKPDTVMAAAVASMRSLARARDVGLSIVPQASTAIAVDARFLQRALENLISNALKYTPAGKEVIVSARSGPEGLHLDVADSGQGIPDELKPGLFAKFGSVEVQQGKQRRGTGLGLYLVRLVVEGHGGSISVQDRPGGGSLFRIWIPPTLRG